VRLALGSSDWGGGDGKEKPPYLCAFPALKPARREVHDGQQYSRRVGNARLEEKKQGDRSGTLAIGKRGLFQKFNQEVDAPRVSPQIKKSNSSNFHLGKSTSLLAHEVE